MTTSRKVEFESDGARCDGCWYLPDDITTLPACVVMGHGFGGTRHDTLAATAAAFADAGYAALTFDYRGFGDSGGEPRQVVDIRAQLADWRAAVRFARTCGACDPKRIALWGSSLGGAHVVHVAAEDEAIAAVVAQVPFDGFPRKVEGRSRRDSLALLWAVLRDRAAGWLGRPPVYVSLIGAPGEAAVIVTDHADHILRSLGGTRWVNRVAPRALLDMMTWYRPSRVADRLRMPLLVCVAARDAHTPAALSLRIARRAPRAEVCRYDATHFEFYEEPLRSLVVADQIAFLARALGGDLRRPSQRSGRAGQTR